MKETFKNSANLINLEDAIKSYALGIASIVNNGRDVTLKIENVNAYLKGCPNAKQPQGVTVCADCGYEIYEGEQYAKLDNKDFCIDCVKNCIHIAENDK